MLGAHISQDCTKYGVDEPGRSLVIGTKVKVSGGCGVGKSYILQYSIIYDKMNDCSQCLNGRIMNENL